MRTPFLALAALLAVAPIAASAAATPAPRGPGFVGQTPDASGTPCPGEGDNGRKISAPPKVVLTPASVANFTAKAKRGYAIVLLTMRMDGKAAISIPPQENFDAEATAAVIAWTKNVHLDPAIPGCARPAGLLLMRMSILDGTAEISRAPSAGAAPAQLPPPEPAESP